MRTGITGHVSEISEMLQAPSPAPNDFAVWLRQAMAERSISGVTLARLVNEQLADGHFAASNISHYLAGRSHPRPAIEEAIKHVLASSSPTGERQPAINPAGPPAPAVVQDAAVPSLQVEDLGGGQAHLVINQRLPWQEVLKVLELLKVGDKAG